MEKARVRMVARMAVYVGLACMAYAILLGAQLWNGAANGASLTVQSLIFATVGLAIIMPAGFAYAMAKE